MRFCIGVNQGLGSYELKKIISCHSPINLLAKLLYLSSHSSAILFEWRLRLAMNSLGMPRIKKQNFILSLESRNRILFCTQNQGAEFFLLSESRSRILFCSQNQGAEFYFAPRIREQNFILPLESRSKILFCAQNQLTESKQDYFTTAIFQ